MLYNREALRRQHYPDDLQNTIELERDGLSAEAVKHFLDTGYERCVVLLTADSCTAATAAVFESSDAIESLKELGLGEEGIYNRISGHIDDIQEALDSYDPDTEGVILWIPSQEADDRKFENLEAQGHRVTPADGPPEPIVTIFDLSEGAIQTLRTEKYR